MPYKGNKGKPGTGSAWGSKELKYYGRQKRKAFRVKALKEGLMTREDKLDELNDLKELVNTQAEDEGLWFITITVSEAYLQQALRELHTKIEELLNGKV